MGTEWPDVPFNNLAAIGAEKHVWVQGAYQPCLYLISIDGRRFSFKNSAKLPFDKYTTALKL